MTPLALILMIIILGGVWGALVCALRKMIKMGDQEFDELEEIEEHHMM